MRQSWHIEVDWPVEDFISPIMTPNFETFRTELDLSIILPSSISGEPRSRHTNFESYFLGYEKYSQNWKLDSILEARF